MNCSTQEIPLWLGLRDEVAGLSPFPATASRKPEWVAQTHTHRLEIHQRVSPLLPLQHLPPCISSSLHPQPSRPKSWHPDLLHYSPTSAEQHTHSHLTNTLRRVFPTAWTLKGVQHPCSNPMAFTWSSSDPRSSWCWSLPTHWLFQHIICQHMYVCISHTHTNTFTRERVTSGVCGTRWSNQSTRLGQLIILFCSCLHIPDAFYPL